MRKAMTSKRPLTPTSVENVVRIEELCEQLTSRLSDLYARWQEDRGDVSHYADELREHLPDWTSFIRMTRAPFGFQFTIGTEAVYRMCVTLDRTFWNRIR